MQDCSGGTSRVVSARGQVEQQLDVKQDDDRGDQGCDEVSHFGATISPILLFEAENLVGRGGDYPMSSQELWDKFADCAERILPREQVAPLFERLETLEGVNDMAQVSKLLEASPLHARLPSRIVLAPAGAEEAPETTSVP